MKSCKNMRKSYEYVFIDSKQTNKIIEITKDYNVVLEYDKKLEVLIIKISDDKDYFFDIKKRLDAIDGMIRAGYYEYTEDELLSAEWIKMYCTNEYYNPLPDDMTRFLDYMYDSKLNCKVCKKRIKEQKNAFKFRKPFKFKKYHATRTQRSKKIFIDDKFKDALVSGDIKGYELLPVLYASGKTKLEGVCQLKVINHLPFAIHTNDQFKEIICENCGTSYINCPSIGIPSRFTYKRADFTKDTPDIVLTKELIGAMSIGADYSIIISNKMYRFLKENGFDKDFKFDIIELI